MLVSFVASFWALDHLNRQTNKRVMSGNVTLPTHSELLILYFPNNTFFFFFSACLISHKPSYIFVSNFTHLFLTLVACLQPIVLKISDSKWPPRGRFRAKIVQMTIKCEFWPTSSNNFNFFIYMLWKILFRDISTGAIWLMLLFKMADLQLFSDWFIFVFHYFTCKE